MMSQQDITYQEAERTGHIPIVDETVGIRKEEALAIAQNIIDALAAIGETAEITKSTGGLVALEIYTMAHHTSIPEKRCTPLNPIQYSANTKDPPPEGAHVNAITVGEGFTCAISTGRMLGPYLIVRKHKVDMRAKYWESFDSDYASEKHPDFHALGNSINGL